MDLSSMTDAQLTTMSTNLVTAINAVLTGAQSEAIGEASFTRASLSELRAMLNEVSREIRLRGDAGGGLILAEFGEAQ